MYSVLVDEKLILFFPFSLPSTVPGAYFLEKFPLPISHS